MHVERIGNTASHVPHRKPQRRIIATPWLHRLGGRLLHHAARVRVAGSFAAVELVSPG